MSREIRQISDNVSTKDMKESRNKSFGRKSEDKTTDEQFEEAIKHGVQAIGDIRNQTGNLQDLTPRKLKDFAKMTKNWIDKHCSEIPGQDQRIQIQADDGSETTVDKAHIDHLKNLYQGVRKTQILLI